MNVVMQVVCPKCGADQPREVDNCWLCGAELSEVSGLPTGEHGERVSFSLSTLMLVMTLACVCFGLIAVAPGLGVFVCIILLPVFVRTTMVVRKRKAKGMEVSAATKAMLVAGSFLTASTIAVLVVGAAFGTFCFACLATHSAGARDASIPLAFFASGAVTLLLIGVFVRWIRRRYQRDTTRS